MSHDDDVAFTFDEKFELQYMKHFLVQAGENSYTLTSEADFDFVYVIAGSGTLSQKDWVDTLEPGKRIEVEGSTSYTLQSGLEEDLSVDITGVRSKP